MTAAGPQASDIVGAGATTCAEFLEDYHRNPMAEPEYFAWAQGYMSAILITRPPGMDDHLDLTPSTFPVRKQLAFVTRVLRPTRAGGL